MSWLHGHRATDCSTSRCKQSIGSGSGSTYKQVALQSASESLRKWPGYATFLYIHFHALHQVGPDWVHSMYNLHFLKRDTHICVYTCALPSCQAQVYVTCSQLPADRLALSITSMVIQLKFMDIRKYSMHTT